jgi:hypothetical protein
LRSFDAIHVSNGTKMMPERASNDIKVSIEVRIEADSEGAARQYAASNGIDVADAKWSPNGNDKGGRLYAATTIFSRALNQQLPTA